MTARPLNSATQKFFSHSDGVTERINGSETIHSGLWQILYRLLPDCCSFLFREHDAINPFQRDTTQNKRSHIAHQIHPLSHAAGCNNTAISDPGAGISPVTGGCIVFYCAGSGVRFPARLHRLNQIQQG